VFSILGRGENGRLLTSNTTYWVILGTQVGPLPSATAARLLHEDIALLELIATRVIVASSRELLI
jgi:hypothetical protein